MVKSKLLQVTQEILNLRRVITNDLSRLYSSKKKKSKVLSKQLRDKFRKREDFMLHG